MRATGLGGRVLEEDHNRGMMGSHCRREAVPYFRVTEEIWKGIG